MLPEFSRRAKRDFLWPQPVCGRCLSYLSSTLAASCIAPNIQQECRMAEPKADVLVLGAGMVGVSAALHLQKRGRDVILVDRNERAGEETSYGNAGLIECASVFPYMFPRDFKQICQVCVEPLSAGLLSLLRVAGFSALAAALLLCVFAGARHAQRDGRIAADPAQPGRARGADRGSRRAGPAASHRLDQAVSLGGKLAAAVRDAERVKQYGVPSEILDRARRSRRANPT